MQSSASIAPFFKWIILINNCCKASYARRALHCKARKCNAFLWILKDTIIDDMYEKKYDFLDENFETIYGQLSESQQKAFKRFLDIHEKADTNKQFKKIINKIKQDLKFLWIRTIKKNSDR